MSLDPSASIISPVDREVIRVQASKLRQLARDIATSHREIGASAGNAGRLRQAFLTHASTVEPLVSTAAQSVATLVQRSVELGIDLQATHAELGVGDSEMSKMLQTMARDGRTEADAGFLYRLLRASAALETAESMSSSLGLYGHREPAPLPFAKDFDSPSPAVRVARGLAAMLERASDSIADKSAVLGIIGLTRSLQRVATDELHLAIDGAISNGASLLDVQGATATFHFEKSTEEIKAEQLDWLEEAKARVLSGDPAGRADAGTYQRSWNRTESLPASSANPAFNADRDSLA